FVAAGHARAVGAEDRRQIGFGIFAGECVARPDQPLGAHRQFLGRAQHPAKPLAVVEPVAARQQQARGSGGDEAAAADHGSIIPSDSSGGTRKRPVIIDRISLIGPASTTITRWTRMNSSRAAAARKWMERAD